MKKLLLFFVAILSVTSALAVAPSDKVYYVNVNDWTTVNCYAWNEDGSNSGWPGLAMTKESFQLQGHDVYSYDAVSESYDKVIFNNGSAQTGNLIWKSDRYSYNEAWYTLESLQSADPQPEGTVYEKIYFVNSKGWSAVKCHVWAGAVATTWPGVDMTLTDIKINGYDVYEYSAPEGRYDNIIFNDGSSNQTDDLTWTTDNYYYEDQWYEMTETPTEVNNVNAEDNRNSNSLRGVLTVKRGKPVIIKKAVTYDLSGEIIEE